MNRLVKKINGQMNNLSSDKLLPRIFFFEYFRYILNISGIFKRHVKRTAKIFFTIKTQLKYVIKSAAVKNNNNNDNKKQIKKWNNKSKGKRNI